LGGVEDDGFVVVVINNGKWRDGNSRHRHRIQKKMVVGDKRDQQVVQSIKARWIKVFEHSILSRTEQWTKEISSECGHFGLPKKKNGIVVDLSFRCDVHPNDRFSNFNEHPPPAQLKHWQQPQLSSSSLSFYVSFCWTCALG